MEIEVIKADAFPVKNFFVRMLTKDISLQDCILDLLDNCIDGASRVLSKQGENINDSEKYSGFYAKINISEDNFTIVDNCGGISLDEAQNYAFHFGRRPDAPVDDDLSIGLYGIGMKRAFFKIGNYISMFSSTDADAFETEIDVGAWEKEKSWDFDLHLKAIRDVSGTEIKISKLNDGVGESFVDSVFVNRIIEIIARDYSFFLQDGFVVEVNQAKVNPYQFKLREGAGFEPYSTTYTESVGEDSVAIRMIAGMAAPPLDDDSVESADVESVTYYGWFVSCNNRIVLAGDKTDKTVWGNEGFVRWHPQYNGFMGIIDFSSKNPNRLPWDTTKRNIELTSRMYKRALVNMKDTTKKYIEYTNQRKFSIEDAKAKEELTKPVSVRELRETKDMVLPFIEKKPRIKMATIQYKRPADEVKRVAESLGSRFMSNKDVGIKTFEYYKESEMED